VFVITYINHGGDGATENYLKPQLLRLRWSDGIFRCSPGISFL